MINMLKLPMKNCGLCGESQCIDFQKAVEANQKSLMECPFLTNNMPMNLQNNITNFEETDTHGNEFDFVLTPFENELSTRKLIRPFRADLIEKMKISKGSYIMGRPMGAGCPITHVLKVYYVDELAGVLHTWVVGPSISRQQEVTDIRAYSIAGFEGIARNIKKKPIIGKSSSFLPEFCMLRFTHFGLTNQIYQTKEGLFVHLEDIHLY